MVRQDGIDEPGWLLLRLVRIRMVICRVFDQL